MLFLFFICLLCWMQKQDICLCHAFAHLTSWGELNHGMKREEILSVAENQWCEKVNHLKVNWHPSSQTRSRCVSLKYVQLKRYSVNKLSPFNWQNFILELIIFVAVGSAVAITRGFFLYFTTNPHHRHPGRRDLWIHHYREVNWLQICPNSQCLLISPAQWNSEFLLQLQWMDRVGYSG